MLYLFSATACIDSVTVDCALLNSLLNLCSDVDHAKTICSKYCGLCNLVDGGWADWSSWTQCDVTCEHGRQLRTRTCTNPEPRDGGADCVGSAHETKFMAGGAFGIVGVRVLCPAMQGLLPVGGLAITPNRLDLVTTAMGIHLNQGYACKDRVLVRLAITCFQSRILTYKRLKLTMKGKVQMCVFGTPYVIRQQTNTRQLRRILYQRCSNIDKFTTDETVVGHNGRLGVYVRGNNLRETAAATTQYHPCSASSVQEQIYKQNHAQVNYDGKVFFNVHGHIVYQAHYLAYPSVVDNVGNGYHSNNGSFVAPVHGQYFFSAQICSTDGQSLDVQLRHVPLSGSEIAIAGNRAHGSGDYDCAPASAPVLLRTGDQVRVFTSAETTAAIIDNSTSFWTSFSDGYLNLVLLESAVNLTMYLRREYRAINRTLII
ncbi:ECT-like protein, partial [Mya arenaria]